MNAIVAVVTVVGSINMDLVTRASHMPAPGETVIGGDLLTVPGGKGANQAVAAARLGAQVTMVGRVGCDAFGSTLVAGLSANGVDTSHIGVDPDAASGVALIIVDDSGQNSIVVAPGANMRLTPIYVDEAGECISQSAVLLAQLECPVETVILAAKMARRAGVTVVLNPAPAQPVPDELIENVDVLVPNESETELLTGVRVNDLSDCAAAASALLARGVGTVILTLSDRGAFLAQEGVSEHFPAFDVTPVDTTAAGDAFVGGFAVALAERRPIREAIQWGNASGALATTKLGAQPSLPSRTAVERLLAAPG